MKFLVLFLAYVQLALAGFLSPRQAQTQQTIISGSTVTCGQYSTIANLSVVSANSTLRGAFLRSSDEGIHRLAAILNTAQAQLPLLIFDVALNERCGNATDIALAGSDANLTNGIILGFPIQAAVGVSPAGPEGYIIVFCMLGTVIIMGGTFMAL